MTRADPVRLPDSLRRYLRAFVAQEGRIALLRAGGWGVAAGLAWGTAACLVDRMLRLPEVGRAAMLLGGGALVAGIWVRTILATLGAYGDWLEAAGGIERAEPRFRQRLRTVVSQLLERSEYRGSRDMLENLLTQVMREIEDGRPKRLSTWRRIVPPWIAAGLAGCVIAGLWFAPVLGMPRLVARLTRPMSGDPPATTTQITVEPRGVRLMHGQPLVVKAHVRRLRGAAVDLLTSHDGTPFTRIPMLAVAEGEYVLTVPALERDLYFEVEAGDARSERWKATILRLPAVAELRVRYEFPAYTQRSALAIANSDGVIEALAGTRVQVTVLSTEDLAWAQLKIGGVGIPMVSAGDANSRQAEFTVGKDEVADLEMTSSGGLPATIRAALSIHAQVDRAPLVRVLEPAGDLRLLPRSAVPVQYQAMDDYGVASLALEVQVNDGAVREMAVGRRGDPRRQEGVCVLDLGRLNVKVGDVVSLALVARDGAGKKSASDVRRILISPRSVDQNTHLRIAELKQAARITAATREELRTAADWLDKARKLNGGPDEDYVAARARLRGSLSNAVEASLLLHQSLLRACAKSVSRPQTVALADCVDRARVQAWLCERLMAMESGGETESILAERLGILADGNRQLGESVRLLSEGEQAWAVLAERSNLRVPASQPAAGPVRQTIQRAQEEMTASLLELGLKPSSRDLDAALQRRVDAELQFTQSRREIEFERPAQDWTAAVARGDAAAPPLVERLASAAEVEGIWPEGDPIAARDLQVAGRAAAKIAVMQAKVVETRGDRAEVEAALAEYPRLLGVLQREHEFSRSGRETQEDAAIYQLAAEARVKMAQWAVETDGSMVNELSGYVPAAEELAMAASAATARRDYEMAQAMDRRLVKLVSPEQWGPSTQPAIARAMEAVRLIDEVSGEQKRLGSLTRNADEAGARDLSQRQRAVAQKIRLIDNSDEAKTKPAEDADTRVAATAAIVKVQERLAHLPQEMGATLEAAEAYRQAAKRSREQTRAAQSSGGSQQAAAAQRSAAQAQRALQDADEALQAASRGLTPQVADRMAAELASFAPETDDARYWVGERLGPALATLQQAMRNTNDPAAAEQAAARLRASLESAQRLLRAAQSKIIESDPLVAARWFAESAAESLSASTPDLPKARGEQETASSALGRAWRNAVQDLASERLSLTPALGPMLGSAGASPQLAGRSLGEMLSGMRQWGFLRLRAAEESDAPLHESQGAGYQEALRVYFDYLNKTQRRGGKR